MSDRIKGSALTMGGAACWGVSGCMGQYLFTREGMDSTWLVPIRLFLAGLILCGFFFIKDRKTLFDPWNVRKNPRNAIDLLVYGLAGVSCCQFTYFLTIQAVQRRHGHDFTGRLPCHYPAGRLHPAKARPPRV